MLCGDGAVKRIHQRIHHAIDGPFLFAQKLLGVLALRCLYVVVQIAVAQVAIVHQPYAGKCLRQRRIGLGHKLGDARYRNRDIVFDIETLLRLGQRNALADMPQRTCLGHAFGHDGIADATGLHSRFQQAFKLAARMFLGLVVRVFQHHAVGTALIKRHALLREMLDDQLQSKLPHHLKAGQASAQVLMRQAQQLHRRLQRRHGSQSGQLRCGQRIELHRGSGNHA